MDDYLKPYGDIELQRRMVSDRPRTNAFGAAIREVVQPGDVVLLKPNVAFDRSPNFEHSHVWRGC